MITGEVEAVDRKQKIRDRYKGVDISELEVIPAKIIEDLETSSVIRRVAAYIRVSTDNDEQTSSYELQKNYYTDYIQAQPGWVFVGIYADEGISGTSLEHRKGMQQLIEDCKAGKIDLVLTKSIARFARNIVDCLSVIELLKNLNPPVGVKFEADNIYTLDSNGRMILTILASVAEEESHSKYPCRRSCLFLLDTKTFWQACNLHYPRFGLGSREVARKRCIQVHSWRRKECCEICGRDHCSKQRRAEVFLGDLRKGDTFYP